MLHFLVTLKKVGDLFMQIYKTKKFNKGWNGFSSDELTSRLNKVLVNQEASQGYGEFLNKNNIEEVKPESLTTQEWEDYQKTKMYERRNPLSGATPDDKGLIIKKEVEDAEKQNLKARTQATEVIENRIQNQLKSMGLSPDEYIYSREIVHSEEGNDED